MSDEASVLASRAGQEACAAPAPRLVLWDIDGTLLRCGPQVGPVFLEALEAVFGSPGAWRGYSFAGRTDSKIVVDLMCGVGWDRDEVLDRLSLVRERYVPNLESTLDAAQMTLLPGVPDLLSKMVGQPELVMGLLTGNWEGGARTKLSRFGLNRYFDFGAFGDDGIERPELVPVALERAERATGQVFAGSDVLVIGDTPHDVECALEHDCEILAVATGRCSTDELRRAGADWVVETLEDVDPKRLGVAVS